MIRAKQPNVVIPCFKSETSNALVQNLRCRRLGSSFDDDPRGSKQLAESGLSLIRVNAFHQATQSIIIQNSVVLSGYLSWNLQRHLPFGEMIGTTWAG